MHLFFAFVSELTSLLPCPVLHLCASYPALNKISFFVGIDVRHRAKFNKGFSKTSAISFNHLKSMTRESFLKTVCYFMWSPLRFFSFNGFDSTNTDHSPYNTNFLFYVYFLRQSSSNSKNVSHTPPIYAFINICTICGRNVRQTF